MKHLKIFENKNVFDSEVKNLPHPSIIFVKQDDSTYFVECSLTLVYDIREGDAPYYKIINEDFINSGVKRMYIDGVKLSKPQSQFNDTMEGQHTVKIVFNDFLIDTNNMFNNCVGLISVDFKNFNTVISNMSYMFNGCYNLINVKNLMSLETVIDASFMFYGCNKLTQFSVDYLPQNCYNMFANTGLTKFMFSGIKNDIIYNFEEMFKGCQLLTEISFNSLIEMNLNQESNVRNMFANISENGYVEYWLGSSVELIVDQLPSTWTKNGV